MGASAYLFESSQAACLFWLPLYRASSFLCYCVKADGTAALAWAGISRSVR